MLFHATVIELAYHDSMGVTVRTITCMIIYICKPHFLPKWQNGWVNFDHICDKFSIFLLDLMRSRVSEGFSEA